MSCRQLLVLSMLQRIWVIFESSYSSVLLDQILDGRSVNGIVFIFLIWQICSDVGIDIGVTVIYAYVTFWDEEKNFNIFIS